MDHVNLYIPVAKVLVGDNFTADVQFIDEASFDPSAPSTVEFRIDCLTNGQQVLTWTTVTPGASVAIAVSSAYNTIITAANQSEVKQITVTGDRGLSFQCSAQKRWIVQNLNLGS
jgi:hypothetical protein